MLQLWQTEWCPASRRIRERLTELGVDYIAHQVPVDKKKRLELARRTGSDSIPALTLDDGTTTTSEDAIRRYLDERFTEPPEAEAHRAKAACLRRRYLEEECQCSQPATR
jgi:glutathione S-transferase